MEGISLVVTLMLGSTTYERLTLMFVVRTSVGEEWNTLTP